MSGRPCVNVSWCPGVTDVAHTAKVFLLRLSLATFPGLPARPWPPARSPRSSGTPGRRPDVRPLLPIPFLLPVLARPCPHFLLQCTRKVGNNLHLSSGTFLVHSARCIACLIILAGFPPALWFSCCNLEAQFSWFSLNFSNCVHDFFPSKILIG